MMPRERSTMLLELAQRSAELNAPRDATDPARLITESDPSDHDHYC